MSSAVIFPAQPENILKGLGKLWTSLGQEEKQQGKPTVLRACAMTLIVATDEPDAGFTASQTISELMHAHPARGIVLAVSPDAEKSLQARVLAQCWKPFGKAQQICCEQIEITARPQSWPHVGPTLIGLTVADLPVIFWCRHQGALSQAATNDEQAGLEAVTELATKIVIDTRGMPAADATALLERWQARGRVVADLEWTRLTPWREPLAHVFDVCEIKLADFHSIDIEHTDEQPSMAALYLAGWLSLYGAKVSFRRANGYLPGVHRVTLRSDAKTIDFARTGPDSAVLRSAGGRECTYNFGEPAVTALMTEELALMGLDPAFSGAFGRVRALLPHRAMSQTASPSLRILAGAQEAADACAAYILSVLSAALAAQPRATIAISGGSTPKLLFMALAKASFDWSKIHFFWVDERCVPPTDSQSNFKLADDALFTPARVPAASIHRIHGELSPEAGAARYNSDIQSFFSLTEGQLPAFDVLHRGMGPDAHTASLFPGEPLIQDRTGVASKVWVEKMHMDRVTLLPGVLLAAKNTVLQVSGEEKADALEHVLRGPEDWLRYPCQIASRDERATWFLDRAAAQKL